MKKQILSGSISAFVSGLILNVIGLGVLLFVISVLLSAATILDPLHAKGRLESFWTGFVVILILLFVYNILNSLSVGILTGFLSQKIKSGWLYLASVFSSIVIHYILLFVFAVGSLIFVSQDIVISSLILFIVFITLTAPIIGLISTAFVRKQQVKRN